MQKIIIEVKDDYINNIMDVLHGLNGVMIEKIKVSDLNENSVEDDFIRLQTTSMQNTWKNEEDKAWDAL